MEDDGALLLENLRALLAVYYDAVPPRDVTVEVEGEVMSYGDLVDRLLNPGRPRYREAARLRRQEAEGHARSGTDVARWRESERRARQRTGRADGDDNPGWQGSGMHWSPCFTDAPVRSHP